MDRILLLLPIITFYLLISGKDEFQSESTPPKYENLKIVFVSWRTGTAEIFLMDSDGSDIEQITNSPEDNRFPLQVDERTIKFTQIDSTGTNTFLQVDIYTKEVRPLIENPIVDGATWEENSPDGSMVAFLLTENRVNNLFIYYEIDQRIEQITQNEEDGFPAHSINHRWSPDGSKIAFMSGPDWYNQFLRVYDLKTGETKQITDRGYMNSGHVWLNDNNTTVNNLKIRDETLYELYSVNHETGELAQLTNQINLHPDITPDGKWIVFESQRHGNYGDIYLMRPDGSDQIRLTESEIFSGRATWFQL